MANTKLANPAGKAAETDTSKAPEPDGNDGADKQPESVVGVIDMDKLLSDEKVLEALLKHDRMKGVIEEAVKKATVKEPEKKVEPLLRFEDTDVAYIKRKILDDALSKLDAGTLRKFALETEGKSLVEKMGWIDSNFKAQATTEPVKPSGLPSTTGPGKKVGYFSEGYKHEFVDTRKKK